VTRVERAILEHALLPVGAPVVVAVSGGPDSVCLLDVLVALAPGHGWRLHVAHLNHGLRGEQSDSDAAFVAELAAGYSLPCTVERRDVEAYRRAMRLSLEAAARQVRYAFLEEVAARTGAPAVALGHTQDDQAETVVLNLLRGSGLDGLRGMPWRRGRFVRPLLGVSHVEVQEYCHVRGLRYRIDPSNFDPAFLRNRVRHELLPVLEGYNPAIRRVLARTAEALSLDATIIESVCDAAWERTVAHATPVAVEFRLAAWRAESLGVQARLLRTAVARLRGSTHDLPLERVLASLAALQRPGPGRVIELGSGLVLTMGYTTFAITVATTVATLAPPVGMRGPVGPVPLAIPGLTPVPALEGTMHALVYEATELPARPAAFRDLRAVFDFDRTGPTLAVRNRRPGDRVRPLGMAHETKLQDVLVNAKVPRQARDLLPIVVSPQHIVWVVGLCLDDRVKVTDRTERLLELRWLPFRGETASGDGATGEAAGGEAEEEPDRA
jgi:tRNA(Ile)-lysidine synthase